MESTCLAESGKRGSDGFVDINYPLEVTFRPVSGVPAGGSAVWSILGTTYATATTDKTVNMGTCERSFFGKFGGMPSDVPIDVGVTVDFAHSQADTITCKAKLVARNKGGNWTQLDDNAAYGTGFSIAGAAVATVEKTFAGWWKTDRAFNAVPFELGLIFQSSKATTTVIARLKNSSRIVGEIILGT